MVGVFFHEALNDTDTGSQPQSAELVSEMAEWDWESKAEELARMWRGEASSESMSRWWRQVGSHMGLLALQSEPSGGIAVRAQSAQEGLQALATTVNETNAVMSGETTTKSKTLGSVLLEKLKQEFQENVKLVEARVEEEWLQLEAKLQQSLMVMLDGVFHRLDGIIGGTGRSSEVDSEGGGMPAIALQDVIITPTRLQVGVPATFSITLRNERPDVDANGLVVALVNDETGTLLDVDTQITDVTVAGGSAHFVPVYWTPREEKDHLISVVVADADLYEITSLSLDPITVGRSSEGGRGTVRFRKVDFPVPLGLPRVSDLTVGSDAEGLNVGQPSSVRLLMSNPYGRPFSEVKATLLVNGKAIQTKTVAGLLPGQSRSLLFPNVMFSQPGKHEVTVSLERVGKKPLMGSLTRQVQVRQKVRSYERTKQVASAVRSILPKEFRVGPLTVLSVEEVVVRPDGQVVYVNDFEGILGVEWSHTATDRTPTGKTFHGQFANETVRLTLSDLPPHTAVTVAFDLFIIRSWDGNSETWGPDVWDLSVDGGPTLFHTTFSYGGEQAYPDAYPGGAHPARTGAAETNTLGYSFVYARETLQADSVYHLQVTFPHDARSLVLNFSGSGLQHLADESWGLDNLMVSVTPATQGN